LLTRRFGGLAVVTLLAGGIVVASPGVAGALGSLSQGLSGSAASVRAGTPWVLTGSVTNSGATSVTGLNTIGSTTRGHILSVDAPCQVNNVGADNATGYSILVCPDPASYPGGVSFPPGFSYTAHVTVDTTGLAGQSITYTGHTNSPDIPGGRTADISATVDVTDPGPTVSITSPLDGQLLDNSADTTFSATAAPSVGASIDSVDFSVDGVGVASDTGAPPYQTIIPVHSLSEGTHTLTATVSDSAGQSASDTISVTQGVGPTVAITSPSNGDTLDTGAATTFSAAATPGTDAAVTSVDFSIDSVLVASIETPLPATNIYQTAIPPNSLAAGVHSLSVRVNDSSGSSASDVVSVTQPPLVGPIVTIKQPNGFSPAFFDAPQSFKTTTTLQSGDAVQSVVWDFDGTVLAGGSPVKPYPITIDPATLGAGTHSLNVTVTSARGVGSDSLTVTVPRATLSLDDATPGDNTIDPLSNQFVPGSDAISDAAWVVPVTNTDAGTARNVTLDVAANGGALSFDLAQMPGCSAATVFGSLSGVRCSLGDIAGATHRYVSVRIPTNGVSNGTQFVGVAQLHSSNAHLPGTSALGATQAIVPAPVLDGSGVQIAGPEVIGILTSLSTQTATFVNTTVAVSPTNQLRISVRTPHRVTTSSLAHTLAATPWFSILAAAAKTVAPPPVAISLSAGDPTDPVVCPPPHGCKGLPAKIGGDFSHYNDRMHPIKVTISTFLPGAVAPNPAKGIAGTVGDLYFLGADGTLQLTGPTGHGLCAKNLVTKAYATPCHLGQPTFKPVVVAGKTLGVIATDTILFVGGDPSVQRR
jgi:hypothetical protein